MEGLKYVKNRYDLHNTPEVKSAVTRHETISEEKVPVDPLAQIQVYFDRFKEISERTNPEERERGIKALKEVLYRANVINPENIPEAYFKRQEQEVLAQEGRSYTAEDKQKSIENIQTDQKDSLDRWVDYLSGPDALYPDWAKYWFAKSVVAMGPYDNQKHEYAKRSKKTTKGFPELNPESLSTVYDLMNSKLEGRAVENPVELVPNPHNPDEQKRFTDEQFEKLLTTESFAKYYAFAGEFAGADNSEFFPNIEGEWKKFPKGSDPDELVESLQGQGTRWCTAGKGTAKRQLTYGDFYVYYSKNGLGDNTIPRVAIRMSGNNISEVRGVDSAADQDIDKYIAPVVAEKMQEFGAGGEKYVKMANGMEHLAQLEDKEISSEEFDVADLRFMYELDGPIKTFSQGGIGNPRIEKLRTDLKNRPFKEDMSKVYGTSDDNEIASKMLSESAKETFKDNLESFKELNSTIARTLIEKSQVYLIMRNLDSFAEEVKPVLIEECFSRSGTSFFEHINVFSLEQQAMAINAISESPRGLQEIANNLKKVTVLSPDIAEQIIKAGYGKELNNNLEKIPTESQTQIIKELAVTRELSLPLEYEKKEGFPKIELETAIFLFDNEYYEPLESSLKNFKGELPAAIALKLLEKDFCRRSVLSNLDAFKKEDFDAVAEKLIELGDTKDLLMQAPYLYLNTDFALGVIESEGVFGFVEYLRKFDGPFDKTVSEAVLNSEIFSGNGYYKFLDNLSLFEGVDHNKVVELMVDAGVSGFGLNLQNFEEKSLSLETAKMLVLANKDYCFSVISKLDKFQIEDVEDFIKTLVSSEEGRQVFINHANTLEKYVDSETLVKKVWQAGGVIEAYQIEGVDHDAVLREVIQSTDSEKVIVKLEADLTSVIFEFDFSDLTEARIKDLKVFIPEITTRINSVLTMLTESGLDDDATIQRFNLLISKLDNFNARLEIKELDVVYE
jgi:hypothetical protein